MVLIKYLQCCECEGRCYPYFSIEGRRFIHEPALCYHCKNEICCGQCSLKVKQCAETGKEWRGLNTPGFLRSRFFYILAYFDMFAPADEIGLLSRQRWSPLFCRTCSTSSFKKVTEHEVLFCPECDGHYASRNGKGLSDFPHTRVLLELNDMFLPDNRKAVSAEYVKLQSQDCCDCRSTIKTGNICASEDGRLRCHKCRKGNCFYFHGVECMFYFFEFLNYLPDMDDLRVLTYSKWTPLKCEKCSVVFSEIEDRMPMLNKELPKIACQKCSELGNTSVTGQSFIKLHFLVDMIKEFRHYFKNNGIDCLPSQRLEPMTSPKGLLEVNNMETSSVSSPATKEPSVSDTARTVADVRIKHSEPVNPLTTHPESYFEKKLLRVESTPVRKTKIPDSLRCKCGKYESTEKMKNCTTCNINALCRDCLLEYHWGHQVTGTMPELLVEVVNSESDKMKERLRKWRDRLKLVHNKGMDTFGNLVSTYETVFLKALESKSPDELSKLMPILDNFSDIDELLMDSMTDIFAKLVKIDDVCEEMKKFTN